MANYVCEHCGMGVQDLKCAKCETSLVHDHLTKDDGSTIYQLKKIMFAAGSYSLSFSVDYESILSKRSRSLLKMVP